ncbi:MAG: peptide chain release factor N(5)-glutamine methyltransferase [Rubrobacteraceae bacterium]
MQTGAVSVRRVVRNAAERLERADVPEPVASAEILLSELLDVKRGDLALRDEPLTSGQVEVYGTWIERRIRREPVQRILGYAYFRSLKLILDESALIPRPDTESVVDAVLNAIDRRGGVARVLDLGAGSGAIAISIAQERPLCEVHATDISGAALEAARRNVGRAGVNVHLHRADMAEGLEDLAGRVDLLVSNPPYVPTGDLPDLAPEVRDWDPATALDGGPDGLLYYRRIFAETRDLLAYDADVVLEVGDGQSEAVLELGSRAGFAPIGVHPDLGGTSRAVLLRRERE